LGGIGEKVACELQELTGRETRLVVLGHLLRAAGLDPQMAAEALGRIKVYEVMAERPLTVTPETGLREAALLMIENKIGGLPVVSNSGDVVGIITESDIFRAFVGMLGAGVATRS